MNFGLTDALDFLTKLIKIPSVQGEPGEGMPFGKDVNDALVLALNRLDALGYSTKNLDGYCGYGTIGEGEKFDVLMHLDVVPEGKGWHYDPYGGEFVDGKLYGRGALDDKGPVAAVLYAIDRLITEGLKPKKQIRIILGCNEESGWKCMDHFAECEEFAPMGISPDGDFPVINCEKGIVYHTITLPLPEGVEYLTAGDRANMVPDHAEIKFTDGTVMETKGKSAHGSHPEMGDNALIKLLLQLRDRVPELYAIGEKFSSHYGLNVGLNMMDAESGSLSLNLGTAKTENGKIVFELDIRYPVTKSMDTVTDILKHNVDGEVERVFYHEPLYLAPDNELVSTLLSAYNKVTGENASPIAIGGGTYARCLKLGCAFGPMFPDEEDCIHQPDEHIKLSSFIKMSDIYYEAFKQLCF